MTSAFDMLSSAAALVGSLGLHHTEPGPAPATIGAAMRALRIAQVELYCDHDRAAMIALREARRAIVERATRQGVAALGSVDEAAWRIRHHDLERAQVAIAHARTALA
jgi:hypothetical protein